MLPSKSNYGDTKEANMMEGTNTASNFQTTNQATGASDLGTNKLSWPVGTNQTNNLQASNTTPNISTPQGTTSSDFGTSVPSLGNASTGTTNLPTASNMGQNIIYHQLPVQVERREKPVIVQEKIVPTERVEIQPVIHREREIPEFRHIIQPLRERNIAATEVRNITLPAEHKPTVTLTDDTFENRRKSLDNQFVAETVTAPVQREVVTKPPIVKEVIRKRIIEEVQPIIYKEVVRPIIVTQTQTVFERIIDKPRLVEQTIPSYEVLIPGEGYGQQGNNLQWMNQQQLPNQQWNAQQQPAPLQNAPELWQRQQGLNNLPTREVTPSSTLMDRRQWTTPPSFTQMGQPTMGTISGAGLSNLPQRQVVPSANLLSQPQSTGQPSGSFFQSGLSGLSNLPPRQVAPLTEYNTSVPQFSGYSLNQGDATSFGQSGLSNSDEQNIPAPPPAAPVEYLWREHTLTYKGNQPGFTKVLLKETTKEPAANWNSSLGGGMTQQTTPTSFTSV